MLNFWGTNISEVSVVLFINFIMLTLRYFIFAGIAYYIFWVWKKDKFQNYRIQEKFPDISKIKIEIKYSVITFIVFALVGVGIFISKKMGYTKIYTNFNDYGFGYFLFSLAFMIIVHDAYFYFAHRLMHHKLLFNSVHRVHHISTNPSPWASFSFHPYEAVLEAAIVPILVFVLPLHFITILSFILFMTLLNVIGHLGYEFWAKGFTRNPLTGWNNTSTHHNLHHQKYNCNYGLYFNWWDKLFDTNYITYHEEYDKIISRRNENQKQNTQITNSAEGVV
jgi:sterol desaturase/sphingolipid hydroxylase (fatty acid hydroxylase superfamily)